MNTGPVRDSGMDISLQQQLFALDLVADRLAGARASLPSDGGEGVWSGDARRMYVYALQQLSALVNTASTCIDEAIRDTRHALALLDAGSRSGGSHSGGSFGEGTRAEDTRAEGHRTGGNYGR
ncbi:hypothetical protein [Frigoribacterium sp. CG_9.8]|uniref:hypothetical protein n=1 Tax=Frigoribacterium sp. CG_9.8 TaxID=2787733 RepID=UPI0018C9D5B6|nr:hypothetical protein [Frigoribacterium sp. CG_9.8]MBG6108657.1 hypothetical protein [Frigoribacterium sp. CG_9.8]